MCEEQRPENGNKREKHDFHVSVHHDIIYENDQQDAAV
jgi:hypothetical protein